MEKSSGLPPLFPTLKSFSLLSDDADRLELCLAVGGDEQQPFPKRFLDQHHQSISRQMLAALYGTQHLQPLPHWNYIYTLEHNPEVFASYNVYQEGCHIREKEKRLQLGWGQWMYQIIWSTVLPNLMVPF